MDHSWGRNISEYGLGGTGATICARYHTTPSSLLVITNAYHVGETETWFVPLDLAADVPYVLMMNGKFAPHFPYGFDVEPDVPM